MNWSFVSRAGHLKALLFIVLVSLLMVLFYGKFINNFFAFDDFKYIENLFAGTRALLLGYNNTMRLLSNLVFVPLFAISGYDPVGYNLFNIILHGINAILVALLMQKISRTPMIGALAGILFAASAASADAILWKCANNSLMSVFFCLTSYLAYLSWQETGRRRAQILSLILFTAAMFSKEDAAALPLIIFLYEICVRKTWRTAFQSALPYAVIVGAYLLVTQLVQQFLLINLEHFQRFISFRPLYSLFGGYSVFLMNPDILFPNFKLFIFLVASGIIAAFFIVKDRRLLLFALVGICIAFLPSSLSALGSFSAELLAQSPSRYTYFPSVMSSLAMALTLHSMAGRLPKIWGNILLASLLVLFTGYNYQNVNARGLQWKNETEASRVFLKALQQTIPRFPPNSHVHFIDAPLGRAFVQQSLRAFYQNPSITWIADLDKHVPSPDRPTFLIVCQWHAANNVTFFVRMI